MGLKFGCAPRPHYATLETMNRSITGCCAAVFMLIMCAVSAPRSYALAETEKGYETALTKGTYQIETGDYSEAIKNLKKALEFKPDDKAATQSLGIAYSRSGDFQTAKEVLQKALDIDKTDLRTRYELRRGGLQTGGYGSRGQVFYRGSGRGRRRPSHQGRETISRSSPIREAPEKAGAFTLRTCFARLQYDSNVILEPSNPVATEGKNADWRAVATANATYPFFKSETASADAGYLFYQSLHESLHNFQRAAAQPEPRRPDRSNRRYPGRAALPVQLFPGRRQPLQHRPPGRSNALPQDVLVSVRRSVLRMGVQKIRRHHRLPAEFRPERQQQRRQGATYRVDLSKGLGATVSYAYDRDSTSAPWWSYKGQKLIVGLNTEFSGLKVSFGLSYYDQRYDDIFPGFTDKRHDQVQEYSVNLVREITRRVSVVASELYVNNRSNLDPFDYTRNIVGLFVDVTL